MQELFTRSLDSLDEIFAFTERFFAGREAEERHQYAVNLVIEELFSNMVKYNPTSAGPIVLELQHRDGAIRVRISDREAEPFDVTAAKASDPEAPLERREGGGLGLLLVQKYVDSLEYAYRDGVSTITFTRKLG